MEAYLAAMEERVVAGQPVDHIRSVASFFISRVDTNADRKLDAIERDTGRSDRERQRARDLRGKVAIANARMAYQAFEEVFRGSRFTRLKEKRVSVQRPLWASTSTKNPAYPKLYYIEALVASDTVNTMPPDTFQAYKNHGDPEVRIYNDLPEAHWVFRELGELNIDERQVSQELEDEGVLNFLDFYEKLLKAIDRKRIMKVAQTSSWR